jgi:excisionase family DNA binding protein
MTLCRGCRRSRNRGSETLDRNVGPLAGLGACRDRTSVLKLRSNWPRGLGQLDRLASPAGAVALDGEAAVRMDLLEGPLVAVLDPAPLAGDQAPVVAAGDDRVGAAGSGSIVEDYSVVADFAGEDAVGAGALVERGDDLAGLGCQDAALAGVRVGLPCLVGAREELVVIAFADAALLLVGVDHIGVALAQAQGGVLIASLDADRLTRQLATPRPASPSRNGQAIMSSIQRDHPAPIGRLTAADVMSVSEVAELLHVPRSTISDWAGRDLLPSVKIGRRRLYVRHQIEARLLQAEAPRAA